MSGEQRTSREKFREVTLCFYQESTHWGFITTESFEIHPSLNSTKHTVFKGNLCSNSPLKGKSFWVHSTLTLSFTKENYRENGLTPGGFPTLLFNLLWLTRQGLRLPPSTCCSPHKTKRPAQMLLFSFLWGSSKSRCPREQSFVSR